MWRLWCPAAQMIYAAYAAKNKDYGEIVTSLSTYSVPLIDMLLFACEQIDSGVVTFSADQTQQLSRVKTMMESARKQLQGKDYNRILVYLDLPVSGWELDALAVTAAEAGDVFVAQVNQSRYFFRKPYEDVTVSAVFTAKEPEVPVQDCPPGQNLSCVR